MRKRITCITGVVAAWAVLAAGQAAWGNSAPVVSNVTASQRGDASKLVDIRYNLADSDGDPCTVWIMVSDDGGGTWKVPVQTVSGHWGANIAPGSGKLIVWDAGADIAGATGTFRVRVWADDGKGPAPMVVVGGGEFPYQNTSDPTQWRFVNTFLIDKYETSNALYAQFLNAGNDYHWDSRMEIIRTGDAGNYYYEPSPGNAHHPVRFVAWSDAEPFAQWRSQLEGVTYRLPTEPEWEKAAAWDPSTNHYYVYGFGQDNIDCSWSVYNYCYGNNSMPIGYLDGSDGRKNAKSYYGCYDMTGNVWEWAGGTDSKVARGGGWGNPENECLCTFRALRNSGFRDPTGGFRLVLDSD